MGGYKYAVMHDNDNCWCVIDKHGEVPMGFCLSGWRVVARTYEKSNDLALWIAAALNAIEETGTAPNTASTPVVKHGMRS